MIGETPKFLAKADVLDMSFDWGSCPFILSETLDGGGLACVETAWVWGAVACC